jgi:DNA-binding NarL/FixJ family response regulator
MTAPPAIRVLVVDDQAVVREGIVGLLQLMDGIEVVASAADGADAIDAAADPGADVVLMDLRMPRVDGIEATRSIVAAHPTTRVIALTTFSDDRSIIDALRAGAAGYLTKNATAEMIVNAVRVVHAGGLLFEPAVHARVLGALTRSAEDEVTGTAEDEAIDGSSTTPAPDGLTPAEVRVLQLMATGLSNPEIAAALHVSMATVKTHINHLFAKAHVRDRGQAVAYAYEHGLVTPTRAS